MEIKRKQTVKSSLEKGENVIVIDPLMTGFLLTGEPYYPHSVMEENVTEISLLELHWLRSINILILGIPTKMRQLSIARCRKC